MARPSEFKAGYLLACCNIVNMHGEETIAADVLAEAGISEADIAGLDLCEDDAEALRLIRASRSEDPIVKLPGEKKVRRPVR